MTQEQKDLLLQDLCARLPYGVKVKFEYVITSPAKIIGINKFFIECEDVTANIEDVKPYLFPLSSMTEEQINELAKLDVSYGDYALHDSVLGLGISVDEAYIFFEFCYKHHIDFLGLIDLGLAIDATGLNIY